MAEASLATLSSDIDGGGATRLLKGRRGRSKLFLALGGVVMLAGAGVGAAKVFGVLDGVLKTGPEAAAGGSESAKAASGNNTPVFFDMPEMVVNLNTGGRRTVFLKVRATLELERAGDVPHVKERLPRITDSLQVYLRELRQDDLKGSGGTVRLREELMRRLNHELAPTTVRAILFQDMIVQ